jgi:hypothetical protein
MFCQHSCRHDHIPYLHAYLEAFWDGKVIFKEENISKSNFFSDMLTL